MALNAPPQEGFARYLLIRRSILNPADLQAYICSCPEDTSFEKLVSIAGTRWQIEQNFEELKGEVGLDHYEVRSYDGWHKHITLACLAHALLTVIKANIQNDAGFHEAMAIDKTDSLKGFKKGRNL
jgi:SRSO17 transposase